MTLAKGPGGTKVRKGPGTEIPCVFGTSGSMRIAAFKLRSQTFHMETLCGGLFWQFGIGPTLPHKLKRLASANVAALGLRGGLP